MAYLRHFAPPLLLACVSVLAGGCYDSHDARFSPARDGAPSDGPIVIDPTPEDAGSPARDAAADASSPAADGEVPIPELDAGGNACEEGEVLPPYDGPGCDDSTVGCLMRCRTDECANMCFDGDPECEQCIFQSLGHCANEEGCQMLWDAFACCRDERCADRTLRACATGPCAMEFDGWSACYGMNAPACGTAADDCFF